MLYILLIIIAIGVLLISDDGKRLLSWIMSLGVWTIITGLIIGAVILIGSGVVFSYDYISDNHPTVITDTLHMLGVLFVLFIIHNIGDGFRYIKQKISKK